MTIISFKVQHQYHALSLKYDTILTRNPLKNLLIINLSAILAACELLAKF